MTTTNELDDRMHIVEQDVRLLRNDVTAMRREMNERFDRAGAQMERIIELLGRLTPG